MLYSEKLVNGWKLFKDKTSIAFTLLRMNLFLNELILPLIQAELLSLFSSNQKLLLARNPLLFRNMDFTDLD